MRTIHLRENQAKFLSAQEINAGQLAKLKRLFAGYCRIEEQHGGIENQDPGHYVRIDGHVGIVGIGHDIQVMITPKVPMNNVLELLRWARSLRLRPAGSEATEQDADSFLDKWVELFINEAEHVIATGLRRTYVERIERAMPIRGRVDVGRTIRRPGRFAPICRFPDFTPDNPLNQLVLAAIVQLSSTPDLGSINSTALASLERQLSRVVSRLSSVSALALPIRYNAVTEHYQIIHHMARLVLSGVSGGVSVGQHMLRGFVLPTDDLFEEAVFELLRRRLGTDYKILWKGTKRFADDPDIGKLNFDIRIYDRDDKALAVLDCKYKQASHHADTYQVIAYAKALDVQLAGLIYPCEIASPHAGAFGALAPIRVDSFVLDVSLPPDSASEALAAEIQRWLKANSSASRRSRQEFD